MYEGKKVRLRALRREDAPFFVRWMNSYETQRNLGGQPHPLNLQDEERWIDSAFTRDDEHPFAVETLDGQLLGSCNVHGIRWGNRCCQVGWAICDPSQRGKGYGRDMIETLLRYCFCELCMHKVELKVFDFNTGAQRLYESVGFLLEGCAREHEFIGGRWHDDCQYGMLDREYFERYGLPEAP